MEMKKKPKKKGHWLCITNNVSSDARNVVSKATNLVIGDAPKIKVVKKKIMRKQKEKI